VILIKQLLLIFVIILFHEIPDSIFIALHSHIFGEISEMLIFVLHFIELGDKGPGKNGILRYICVASACDLVEPLQVLKIRHKFIDPFDWLVSVQVVAVGIFLYWHRALNYAQESLDVLLVKV